MSQTIQQIASALREQVENWLKNPDESSEGVAEARKRIEDLPIAPAAKRAALRALAGSERDILRARQKEAADAVSAALMGLGVRLQPLAPPQRQRRKGKSKTEPDAPKPEEASASPVSAATSAEVEAPAPEKRSTGGVFGLGRRTG